MLILCVRDMHAQNGDPVEEGIGMTTGMVQSQNGWLYAL